MPSFQAVANESPPAGRVFFRIALWLGLLPPLFAYSAQPGSAGASVSSRLSAAIQSACNLRRVLRGIAGRIPEQRDHRALDGRDL
jgi:hypothetical protein